MMRSTIVRLSGSSLMNLMPIPAGRFGSGAASRRHANQADAVDHR